MTPADIIAKLFRSVDRERVEKAKGMASRSKLPWADVLAAMTAKQRTAVTKALED